MKYLLVFAAAACLSACNTLSPGGNTQVIKEDGATITYRLPQGWKAVQVEEPADHFNIIAPAGADKPSDPSITIDYRGASKATEEECAKAYLASVRDLKDPKVRMSRAGTVRTTTHGVVTVYRLASAYYGDHLAAFLVEKRGHVVVELWTENASDRERHDPAFREVVQGLSVKN